MGKEGRIALITGGGGIGRDASHNWRPARKASHIPDGQGHPQRRKLQRRSGPESKVTRGAAGIRQGWKIRSGENTEEFYEGNSGSKSVSGSEDGRSGIARAPAPAHQTRCTKFLPAQPRHEIRALAVRKAREQERN